MPVPDYEAGRRQVGALFLSVSSHQSSKERGRAEGLNGDNERASVRRQNGFLKQVRNHKTKLWVFRGNCGFGHFHFVCNKKRDSGFTSPVHQKNQREQLMRKIRPPRMGQQFTIV